MTKKLFVSALVAALIAGAGVWVFSLSNREKLTADPTDEAQVTQGKALYGTYCASCHGVNLQGQPNWRERDAAGFLPAPPHDQTGHTWHHPDAQLFAITKQGVKAFAPAGYQSRMEGYEDRLTDAEIWSVLAYIKSRWPREIQQQQAARTR